MVDGGMVEEEDAGEWGRANRGEPEREPPFPEEEEDSSLDRLSWLRVVVEDEGVEAMEEPVGWGSRS